jgi:hypothetical protein
MSWALVKPGSLETASWSRMCLALEVEMVAMATTEIAGRI